ncbi:MAG: hypothetical protein ACPL1I_08070 [bacterium]
MKCALSLLVSLILVISLVPFGYSKDPVTIKFWINHGIEDEPLFKQVISNFEKANPDIKN